MKWEGIINSQEDRFRISYDELEKWFEINEVKFNKNNCKVLCSGEIKCTDINGLGSMLARKDPGITVALQTELAGVVCITLRFHQDCISDETCPINGRGDNYSSVLTSVLLSSGLDLKMKGDVVDKGARSQWHQQGLDVRFEKQEICEGFEVFLAQKTKRFENVCLNIQ